MSFSVHGFVWFFARNPTFSIRVSATSPEKHERRGSHCFLARGSRACPLPFFYLSRNDDQDRRTREQPPRVPRPVFVQGLRCVRPETPKSLRRFATVVVESNNEIPVPRLTPRPLRSPDPATGLKRDKKEFSQRQLQLPQKQFMSCRHCNEAEKDEAKAERRKSLDESRELKTGEVHNKGRQVHNNFKSMSRVA